MVFALLGGILFLIYMFNEFGFYDFLDGILYVFLSVLIGILFGVLGITISTTIVERFDLIEKTTYVESEKEIYALKDMSGIKGDFYLFGGNIGGEYQYRYVVNTPRGKQVETVSSEQYDVYIKEGNYKPKVVCEKTKYINEKFNGWLVFPYEDYTYTIYVPDNTILNNYDIDLE